MRDVEPEDYASQPDLPPVTYRVRKEIDPYESWTVSRISPIGMSWYIARYDSEDAANAVAFALDAFSMREVH